MNILLPHQRLAAQSLLVSRLALQSHQMLAASKPGHRLVRPQLPHRTSRQGGLSEVPLPQHHRALTSIGHGTQSKYHLPNCSTIGVQARDGLQGRRPRKSRSVVCSAESTRRPHSSTARQHQHSIAAQIRNSLLLPCSLAERSPW